MLNIFIIDDEIYVRKWLSFCIGHQPGSFRVVGESSNVQEGVKKMTEMTELPVHVLILDIMLPGINGLDAIEMVRELFPDISIIILTNYAEFEYIQKALHRGAEEYFLKSELTEQELGACLGKIAGKKRHFHNQARPDYERMTLQTLGTQIFNHAITSREQFCSALETLPKPENFSRNILVMAIRHGESFEILLDKDSLSRISPYLTSAYALPCAKGVTLLVCEMAQLRSNLALINEYVSVVQILSGSFSFHYMGISNVYYGFQEYFAAVSEALLSMNYGFYRSCVSVTFIWDTEPQKLKTADIENFSADILKDAREKTFEKLNRDLDMLFTYLKNTRPYDLTAVVRCIQNLSFLIASAIFTDNPALVTDMVQKKLSEFDECLYLDDIRKKMGEILCSWEGDFARPNYSPVIVDTLAYLEEHFCESITLKELSREVHINADYLGQLFKKEVGESFNTYLTNKKMAYADYLIRTTNLKKYEVAEKVGYSNFSYFSRIYNAYKNKKKEP